MLGMLTKEHFYHPAHKVIFRAIEVLDFDDTPPDLLTVKNQLVYNEKLQLAGSVEYLINLNEVVPTAVNAEHYCKIVLDYWRLRELQTRGRAIDALVADPELTPAEKVAKASEITKGLYPSSNHFEDIADIVLTDDEEADYLPLMIGGGMLGSIIGGLYLGQLTTLEFPTGHGKTMTALNICYDLLRRKGSEYRMIYVTLADLQPKDLKRRLLTMHTGLRSRPKELPENNLYAQENKQDREAWDQGVDLVNSWTGRFKIYGAARLGADSSVEGIMAALDAELDKSRYDLIVIDYAQKLRSKAKSESMTADATRIAAELGLFAGRWGKTAFVVLSQISKDGDTSWSREWMNQAAVRVQGKISEDQASQHETMIEVKIEKHRFLPVEGKTLTWFRHGKRGTVTDA
jgi:replicative DNA helicase